MAIGLVIDAVTYPRDYATDAAMKAETSNGLAPGELAFSAESGIYAFETASYQPAADDLKLDSSKGYWRKLSDPYIALEANSQISDLNIPGGPTLTLAEGKIFVGNASNDAAPVSISGDATLSSAGVLDLGPGVIANAEVNSAAAIDFSKLAALPAGQVLVGSASNVPTAVALSGDITVNATGVTAIAAGAIVDADISASAAIAFTKLAPLTSAQFMVGNASNQAAGVALSGDVSATNTGVVTVGNGAVTQQKMDSTVIRNSVSALVVGKQSYTHWANNEHPKVQIKKAYVRLVDAPDSGTTITAYIRNGTGTVAMSNVVTFTQGTDAVGSVKAFNIVTAANADQLLKSDALQVITGGTTTTSGVVEVVMDVLGIA